MVVELEMGYLVVRLSPWLAAWSWRGMSGKVGHDLGDFEGVWETWGSLVSIGRHLELDGGRLGLGRRCAARSGCRQSSGPCSESWHPI